MQFTQDDVTKEMRSLITSHLTDTKEIAEVFIMYSEYANTTILFYDGEDVVGFVTYFALPIGLGYILAIHKDNKFTKNMIKAIIQYVETRDRTIVLKSDSNNPLLHRLVDKYGGYWKDDYMIFEVKETRQSTQ